MRRRFLTTRRTLEILEGRQMSDGDLDHHDLDRRISDISQIVFNGHASRDYVSIDTRSLNAGVSVNHVPLLYDGGIDGDWLEQIAGGIRTLAWGDPGDDMLNGSKFNDMLYGGDDNDMLNGWGETTGCSAGLATII